MCQPGRPGRSPDSQDGSPGLRRLPQHEVARVFLLVLVGVDPRAALDAGVIEARQLAVLRERRDLEVDRPVAAVGVAVALERLDHVGHRRDVLVVGGARLLLDRLEAERRGVLAERGDELVRVLAQRHAGLLRLEDGAVVHVGVVHHVPHVVALLVLQRAAQHVERDEGAEVADVAARVDRQAAGVHADPVVPAKG